MGIWGGSVTWARKASDGMQDVHRRGGAGKGSGSKGCRGAEHGQAYTKDCTGAMALRAAIKSAVQLELGRGDKVNMQAELANPTEGRDSLQMV
jgi:hypothetical protein